MRLYFEPLERASEFLRYADIRSPIRHFGEVPFANRLWSFGSTFSLVHWVRATIVKYRREDHRAARKGPASFARCPAIRERRHVAGGMPTPFLKARLKAASDS